MKCVGSSTLVAPLKVRVNGRKARRKGMIERLRVFPLAVAVGGVTKSLRIKGFAADDVEPLTHLELV